MSGSEDKRNADLCRDDVAEDRKAGTFEVECGSAQRLLCQKLAGRTVGVLQRVVSPGSGGALCRSLVGRMMAVIGPRVVMVVMGIPAAGRIFAVVGFRRVARLCLEGAPRLAAATISLVLVEQARERDDQHVAGQHGGSDPAAGGSRKGHHKLLESKAHMQFIC